MNQMQKDAEDRTLKLAGMFMNGKMPKEDDDDKPAPTFMEGIMQSLPGLLQLFLKPGLQQAPMGQQTGNNETVQLNPSADVQRGGAAAAQPPAQEVAMPNDPTIPLSEDERKHFAAARYMLLPFVSLIMESMKSGKPMIEVGASLADYVPYKLEDQMIELATLTKERGAKVLSFIHPDLATADAVQVVQAIADIILAEGSAT